MSVMDVRPMRMGVCQGIVVVLVGVAKGGRLVRMHVEMVAVVVPMTMRVGDPAVSMKVDVLTREESRDGRDEDHSCSDQSKSDGFTEKDERERCADERGAREDRLRTGGSEIMSRHDVERDARAVAQRADREGRGDRFGRCDERRRGEADCQIHTARDDALHERASRGGDSVDESRQVIVDGPTQACSRGEQRAREAGPAPVPGHERTGPDGPCDPNPARPTQMLTKEDDPEQSRRDHFEIEQERDGTGERETKCREQQDRSDHPAEEHRAGKARGVQEIETGPQISSTLERDDGSHPQCRTEIEESRELEGLERPEQQLARGRRRAE